MGAVARREIVRIRRAFFCIESCTEVVEHFSSFAGDLWELDRRLFLIFRLSLEIPAIYWGLTLGK
jgi:hypothetical protein